MRIETYQLVQHGWVPNNARLPVILYRQAIVPDPFKETAVTFEESFARHGWPAQWRDGIYDYHHYHSTAHEVLGMASGSARLMIGGPGGREMEVRAGDALLLPTGTGHCLIEASSDFLVVGGYPDGQQWDICCEAPTEAARKRMAELPFPKSDPVAGTDGPTMNYWR